VSARPVLTPARLVTAGAVLAAVVALTLAPRAIAWPARTLVLDALDHLPPSWSALVFGAGADVALNVAFFVLLLPLRWAPASVALCALVSFAVEVLQAGIPGRVPDADDVLSNTIGAAIGTVVVIAMRVAARGGRAARR
jgi:hypothetical protein